jgi:tRNA (cytidine/uridine-2'-O-)-methyltransferase
MFTLVLFEPEIPPNTGNIIRLAANTGARLVLIEPLGFDMDEKKLRRAGLDYREFAEVITYPDYSAFLASESPTRLFGVTTKATQYFQEVNYQPGDYLMFGPETRGLPAEVLSSLGTEGCIRIPMIKGSRSLNLSNSAAIVLYEAWRQCDYTNGV